MEIKLLYNTPLWVASTAIRKCWASEDKSDTDFAPFFMETSNGSMVPPDKSKIPCGPKDKELVHRVGNKNKHASTLEHVNYSFDIDGISRACLQELARHRHASMSVKSSRYTLKELKEATSFDTFLVPVNNEEINKNNIVQLGVLAAQLRQGLSNDVAKYSLPEAYKTSLVWTLNMRSLQNFLELRTNKAALWEIRELAYKIYDTLPEEHKYMFTEFIYKEKEDV